MLSALKKLTTGRHEAEIITPPGLQAMSKVLQNKFSKGVQYNMKIIIKGDRNVGKSCLFNRLQGLGFAETYIPTEEIQVTSIQWNYKATDDIVKVEVWDVVDKGKKRILSENLKLELNNSEKESVPALDAEFLNVYKGTNGVILMMDITKNWTFEYVQREIEKIPTTIPVLVLGNHCDMSHHRAVTPDHVLFYLETLNRSAPARYAESSMSNGFGLKFLHKWFNLPFLQLQRQTLLAQLNTNENEISITTQELDLYQQTDDSSYNVFMERLTAHRRKVAENNSSAPSSSIVIQTQHSFPASVKQDLKVMKEKEVENENISNEDEIDSKIRPEKVESKLENLGSAKIDASLKNIEEFVPDDYLDKSFLDEPISNTVVNKVTSNESDSESEITGNPLVSGFQDDLDPEDTFITKNEESVNNLGKWMNSERGSPDGGDDFSKIIDSQSKSESKKKDDKSKKKKCSKKKKKEDSLEIFLNADESSAYEAL